MPEFLKRWWNGTTEIEHFDNLNDDPSVQVFPLAYVRHHWTAKAARGVVRFLRVHWAFFIGTLLALISIWVGVLSLK